MTGQQQSADPTADLKEKDVADMVGLSVQTVRWWRYAGRGPRFYKIGSRVFYKRTDVEDWLEAQYLATRSTPTAV